MTTNDSFEESKAMLKAYLKVNMRLLLDEPYEPGKNNENYHHLSGKVAACIQLLNMLQKSTTQPIDNDMMTQVIKALHT